MDQITTFTVGDLTLNRWRDGRYRMIVKDRTAVISVIWLNREQGDQMRAWLDAAGKIPPQCEASAGAGS